MKLDFPTEIFDKAVHISCGRVGTEAATTAAAVIKVASVAPADKEPLKDAEAAGDLVPVSFEHRRRRAGAAQGRGVVAAGHAAERRLSDSK